MNRHLTLLLSGNDRTEVNRHSPSFFQENSLFLFSFSPGGDRAAAGIRHPSGGIHEWGPDSDSSIIQSEKRDFERKFLP
jgi:hypothetical protein